MKKNEGSQDLNGCYKRLSGLSSDYPAAPRFDDFRAGVDFFEQSVSGFAGSRVCTGEEVTRGVRNKHEMSLLSGDSTMCRTLLSLILGLGVLVGAATMVFAGGGHGGGGHGGGFGGHGGGFGGHGMGHSGMHPHYAGGHVAGHPAMHPHYAGGHGIGHPGTHPQMRPTIQSRPMASRPAMTSRGNLPQKSRVTLPKSYNGKGRIPLANRGSLGGERNGFRHGVTAASMAGAKKTTTRGGALTKNTRGLSLTFSPTVSGLLGSGSPLPQGAKNGLLDVLAGKPMNQAETNAVKNALATQNLNPQQQATLIQALSDSNALKSNGTATVHNKPTKHGGGGSGGSGCGAGGGDPGVSGDGAVADGGGSFGSDTDGLAGTVSSEEDNAIAPAVASLANRDEVFGCEITEMDARGTAKRDGLVVGDVILAIGDTPTPDFDSMRAALQSAGREVEAVFLNKENGEVERIVLHPLDTRLGVTVEEVQVR